MSSLDRSLKGEAALRSNEVHGPRRDLDAALQKPENDAIRDCMKPYQKQLTDCLQGTVKPAEPTPP